MVHYGFAYFAHNVGGGDEIELTNNLNMSVPNSVSFAYWGWDWLLTRIRGGERELIVIKNMSSLVCTILYVALLQTPNTHEYRTRTSTYSHCP